jgi:serine/threonine-protein kinase
LLGQGTTGEVWRATRRDDGAGVAVKMLRPEFADDPVVIDRFLREWRILYDIDSPELVRVLDLVNERDALAIVMELVDGPDLREYLRHAAPMPVADAIRVVTQVLWALDTVHGAGVVHRDVKPENVLLDERRGGRLAVRLTDFGIARMMDTLSRGRALTGPIGTPLYMAPELGTGGQPTPAADIYSAGILLYELLAGSPPFDEAHPTDMLQAHLEQEPLPIKGVPRAVWEVLAAMLAKSPRRRPPSAADAARALEGALRASQPEDTYQRREDDDTWERGVAREDRMAGVGAMAGGAGMAAKAAGPDTRAQGGYGRGGYDDDWGDARTSMVPPVRGGGRWDEDATQLGPGIGGPSGPGGRGLPPHGGGGGGYGGYGGDHGGRDDRWDDDDYDYDDPPTDGGPVVRVPSRAGIQSNRNTIISPIPASHQPTPSLGSRPPTRDNRQRMRLAAGAAAVVLVIAAAGGWALASSGGKSNTASDETGTSGGASTPYMTVSAGQTIVVNPTATAPYTAMVNGKATVVQPGKAKGGTSPARTQQGGTTSSNAGAPTSAGATTPSSATVPNIVGMTQSAAANAVAQAGFTKAASFNAQCLSSSVPVGQVSSQDPAAGTTADKSTAISAVVAADCRVVPNELGQDPTTAKNDLANNGFQVWLNGPWQCPTGSPGFNPVTDESNVGATLARGSTVSITYSCQAVPTTPAASPTH